MLPPGPRLPKVVQAALLARHPVAYTNWLHARYGDVHRISIPGFPRFVYVSTAAQAREVYAADRTIGRAGEARREFLEPVVGPHSMLVTEGEEWLQHRKLLGPAFHRRVVDDYREEIAAITRAEIARFPVGRPFELRPHMQRITLEVILRLVFGLLERPPDRPAAPPPRRAHRGRGLAVHPARAADPLRLRPQAPAGGVDPAARSASSCATSARPTRCSSTRSGAAAPSRTPRAGPTRCR